MAEGIVTMSMRELDRVGIIEAVVTGGLTQREATERLGLSVRQIKRLVRRYPGEGPQGLASRRRGRPSNNVCLMCCVSKCCNLSAR